MDDRVPLLRRLLVGLLLATGLVLGHHAVAVAQEGGDEPAVTEEGDDIGSVEGGQDTAVDDAIVEEVTDDELEPFIGVDTWLALLGIATPFITAVLAPAHLSDGLKALVSAVVVGVVTIVKQGLIDGDLTLPRFVNGSIQVLIFHLGTWLMAMPAVRAVNDHIGVGTVHTNDGMGGGAG